MINTAAPLTISSVSQTGGNVQIVNTGGMTLSGTATDSSGIISLYDRSAGIQESTSGTITANLLIDQCSTGTTLNNANAIAEFYASNATSGDVQLNNTTALTIVYLNETGGNIQVVNAGGSTVTGAVTDTGGNVSLDETSANIMEYSTGTFAASLLTAESATGTILSTANAVASFTATNTTSGDIQLNNTTALTVNAIDQTGRNVQIISAGGDEPDGSRHGCQRHRQPVRKLGGNPGIDFRDDRGKPSYRPVHDRGNPERRQRDRGFLRRQRDQRQPATEQYDPAHDHYLNETGGNIQVVNAGGITVTGSVTVTTAPSACRTARRKSWSTARGRSPPAS